MNYVVADSDGTIVQWGEEADVLVDGAPISQQGDEDQVAIASLEDFPEWSVENWPEGFILTGGQIRVRD